MTPVSSLLEAAQAIAQAVNDGPGESVAYTDPAEALANRPCLLIGPPLLEGGTLGGAFDVTWPLIALSSYDAGQLAALAEIQVLIKDTDDVLSVERARPIQYQLTAERNRVAAYELTHTAHTDL